MTRTRVPAPSIVAALEHALGPVHGFVPLAEGEESQAFAFRAEGLGSAAQAEHVVRVHRSREGFDKDDFAARRFARPGLPVPAVTAIGRIEDLSFDQSFEGPFFGKPFYCVSRRLPGSTLQDLPIDMLSLLAEPLARTLEELAASDLAGTTGFGRFDANGTGEHASWRAFLDAVAERDWSAARLDAQALWRVERQLAIVRGLAPSCPEVRRLVHGDFGSNNVLTDGREITGVIDWSEALFGDPLYDVANIFFWRPWLACMEQQARHFEQALPADPGTAERLRCYQLHIGLRQIHDCALAGEAEDLLWALERNARIAGQA